jgi:hypothetical protein
MNPTDELIKSIAGDLDAGMIVYLHIETNEIKTIIDFNQHYDADMELWEEDIREIEDNIDKYLQFEPMDSREAFRVMEDFVETVEDERLREKLYLGLSLSKPFRNFKDIIDNAGEYRQRWFDFKNDKYIEYVKEQLDSYNSMDEL